MKRLNYFYFLSAICFLICSCAKLPVQLSILEEVYQNEADLFQVRNEITKKNIATLTKSKLARRKLKNLMHYCTSVEHQKKLNAQTLSPCKVLPMQLGSLHQSDPIAPIVISSPSSPAMRNQVEMANQTNQQINQQRAEEIRYRNLQMELEAQKYIRVELQKCKADSVANSILIQHNQLANYLNVQEIGDKLKIDFLRANRKLLNR
jgi:hypothetical protein